MIYLFWGEDTFRSRQKLRELTDDFIKSREPPAFFHFDAGSFDKTSFEELLKGKNLFSRYCLVICERILSAESGKETAIYLKDKIDPCSRSENIFLFWEENLAPPILEIFKSNGVKAQEFKFLLPKQIRVWLRQEAGKRNIKVSPSAEEEILTKGKDLWLLSNELEKYALSSVKSQVILDKQASFNVFHIVDAISEKDRSRAWLLFQKALFLGFDPEEVFWKIVWQIKNLMLVKKNCLNLHPYVFKKINAASRFFTEEELSRCSLELINLYHNSRRGLVDMETGVEKFLIKL
jgi:DNA polymerase III delta subunit